MSDVKPTAEEIKILKRKKAAHAAHVNLIMLQDDVPKPTAEFKAYCEGEDGFNKRIPSMPRDEPELPLTPAAPKPKAP